MLEMNGKRDWYCGEEIYPEDDVDEHSFWTENDRKQNGVNVNIIQKQKIPQ